jgi:hypothetical protein
MRWTAALLAALCVSAHCRHAHAQASDDPAADPADPAAGGDAFARLRQAVAGAHAAAASRTLQLAGDSALGWLRSGRPPGASESIWLAAGALAAASLNGGNASVAAAGLALAAAVMAPRLAKPYYGGNDGWESWAAADTFLRFRPLIEADKTQYRIPAGQTSTAIPSDRRTKLASTNTTTLGEIFELVLRYSQYLQVDQTSNHAAMNSAGRFLAELAFPGMVGAAYKPSDPTGESTVRGIATTIVKTGYGEYGSPNYGIFNIIPLASVYQGINLAGAANKSDLAEIARRGYEAGILQMATFYFSGNLAQPGVCTRRMLFFTPRFSPLPLFLLFIADIE